MLRRNFIRICGASASVSAFGQPAPKVATDKHRLIVQVNGDGGDTAQREGWAWLGSWVREKLNKPWEFKRTISFPQVMALLEDGQSGVLRRHPDQWNKPQDFSRDQTIPIVAALGVWNDKQRLQRLWEKTQARNFLAQNGDMLLPEHVNLFQRALGNSPSILGDGQLGLSVAARISSGGQDMDDVGDDLNLLVMLIMSKIRSSTSISETAVAAYGADRPVNYGCYIGSYRAKYGIDASAAKDTVRARMDQGIRSGAFKRDPDCPPVLGALRWYFRTESGGNPELAELYAPIIRAWFQPGVAGVR